MEIKIQISGRVFALCFGRKTHWFAQMNFMTLTEEFYKGREVVYAKLIFRLS